jgi:octaprenyl-diphosphate synthase
MDTGVSNTIIETTAVRVAADWVSPVILDLARVEAELGRFVPADMPIAAEAFALALAAGGKRLRPALCLLSAGACGGVNEDAVHLATVVEVVHLASLMHDDVVDEAELRRGQAATRVRWGNRASVLVGDYLAARAYRALTMSIGDWATGLTCEAIVEMCQGQFRHATGMASDGAEDTHGPEAAYMGIIRDKTGSLFRAACEMGARAASYDAQIPACGDAPMSAACAEYGMALGVAFQIVDDLLDLYADPAVTGKPLGSDLRTGQYTLPIIAALRARGSETLQDTLAEAGPGRLAEEQVLRVARLADDLGGRDYAAGRAREFGDAARAELAVLPASEYREGLHAACDDVLSRVP